MTVNHASILTKDYFIAYLKLIMNSREYTLIQAKEFAFDFFFKEIWVVTAFLHGCNSKKL